MHVFCLLSVCINEIKKSTCINKSKQVKFGESETEQIATNFAKIYM